MAAIGSLQSMKLDNSLGAMLIGALVSSALFGLTTLQTYLYYINYRNDRATFRWLVGVLWVLDFLHSIFVSHSTYYFTIQQYGNPLALLRGEWSIIAEIGVTVAVTLLVQLFFAHRVYKLTDNSYLLAGLIVALALAHTATGLVSTVKLAQIKVFARLPEVLGIITATLIVMAANDLLITAVLCWYLRKSQSTLAEYATFTQTQSALQWLIIYTIETGLLTSVSLTIDAICVLTMPRNWIFIGITFCVSKLYANSLLTILNSRQSLRNKDGTSKFSSSGGKQWPMTTSLQMQDMMSEHSMNKLQELSPTQPASRPNLDFGAPSEPSVRYQPRYAM